MVFHYSCCNLQLIASFMFHMSLSSLISWLNSGTVTSGIVRPWPKTSCRYGCGSQPSEKDYWWRLVWCTDECRISWYAVDMHHAETEAEKMCSIFYSRPFHLFESWFDWTLVLLFLSIWNYVPDLTCHTAVCLYLKSLEKLVQALAGINSNHDWFAWVLCVCSRR